MINITIEQWNAALNHDDVIWRNWRSALKAIIPRCLFIVPSLKVRSIGKSWTHDYQDHVISWSRLHDFNGTQQQSRDPEFESRDPEIKKNN